MKTQKNWHKYGSFALLFGFIISIYSGMAKQKKLHALSAFLIGFGTTACIYSGHKLIAGYASGEGERGVRQKVE